MTVFLVSSTRAPLIDDLTSKNSGILIFQKKVPPWCHTSSHRFRVELLIIVFFQFVVILFEAGCGF